MIEPLESRIAPATLIVTTLAGTIADDGELSLPEAVATANGTRAADTIKFAPTLAGVITLPSTLNITETLTILGGGKITLSGNNTVRILAVNNADTVKDHPLTVSGLTFTKGKTTQNGGAIQSTEGLTILNCIFADNTATESGGAVHVSTTTGAVTVKATHFVDNKSTGGLGGGLLATATKGVTMAGSVFAGNSANIFGGANLSVETGAAKVVVTGSVFANNTATGGGGGGLGVSGKSVAVAGTRFTGNTAGGDGGGLVVGGGGYTLSGLQFFGNTATVGGAISSTSDAKTITLTKSVLEGNTATLGGGGGIYLGTGLDDFVATISASKFVGNTAQTHGGGVFAEDAGGRVTISGSLFTGNTAGNQGGGIAIHQNDPADAVFTLTGNTISGNVSNGSAGGLSLFRHGDFILTKNVIAANRTTGSVGGVSFDVANDVTFKDNRVVGNRAGTGVGGMDFVAGSGATFTNSGNVIAHNEGGATGGLKILSDANVTIAKTTKITGNIGGANNAGGGLTIEAGSGTVTLLAVVTGNYNRVFPAGNQLGSIYNGVLPALPAVSANITVTTLADTGPGSLRAAIAQADASPAADKIKFDDSLDGVIVLTTPLEIDSSLTIYGRGRITLSGGGTTGIMDINDDLTEDKDSPVTLSGLTFANGKGTRGSAIAAFESVTILDCLFVDNDATSTGGAQTFNGGAIFAELGKAALTIRGSHFSDNKGALGGGVFASSDKALTVVNSVFAGNSGTSGGGANLVGTATGAKISVSGSIFTGNGATEGGGGLAVRGFVDGTKASTTSVVNSLFTGSTAQTKGGGLQLQEGALALTGVQIVGNSSAANGGGLALGDSSSKVLTVSKSLIAANSVGSDGGGGVYIGENGQGFTATFSATEILGNTAASGLGGGIYGNGTNGQVIVLNSTIAGNLAKTGGGVATRGTGTDITPVVLTGNVIAGNEAETGAGLSLVGDGALALTKNLIVANDASLGGGGGALQSIAKITLKGNSVLANRGLSGVGGLAIDGPAGATFSTAGDIIAFNEGSSTGGLRLGSAIAGIIAKSMKITANVGEGPIAGGGLTNGSTASVKLLATVLGNFNRTNPAQNEIFGLFAP